MFKTLPKRQRSKAPSAAPREIPKTASMRHLFERTNPGSEQTRNTYATCSDLNVGIISASRAVKGEMPSPAAKVKRKQTSGASRFDLDLCPCAASMLYMAASTLSWHGRDGGASIASRLQER